MEPVGFVTRRAKVDTTPSERVKHLGDGSALKTGAQTRFQQYARVERMQPATPDQARLSLLDLRVGAAIGLSEPPPSSSDTSTGWPKHYRALS